MPSDWERASFQQTSQASPDLKTSPQNGASFPSSGGYGQGSLVADEESQEFDDLIFALKTGMYEPTTGIRNWQPVSLLLSLPFHESANVLSATACPDSHDLCLIPVKP